MGSEAAAAMYGALVGGMIALAAAVLGAAGVLVGRYVTRRLQERRTKLHCVLWGWEMTEADALGRAVCSFRVDLFSERPLATGLRGICVEFIRQDEQQMFGRLWTADSDEELGVLNLPPRRWVSASVYAFLEGEERSKLSGFRRADFVGYFPNGGEFRRRIVERKDFVASRKRAVDNRKSYTHPWWRRVLGGRDEDRPSDQRGLR